MNTLRQLRNFWIPCGTTIVLAFFSEAGAQVRYKVTDLGRGGSEKRFLQGPGLAEKLVTGRSADFLDYFFQFAHFTTREKEHYVSAYSSAAQLHAAFEMYRAFPAIARFNASETGSISIELFFGAGEHSPFAKMVPVFAEGLRVNGCRHVNTGLIPGAVHYIVEDQPAEVAELIERYAETQPE